MNTARSGSPIQPFVNPIAVGEFDVFFGAHRGTQHEHAWDALVLRAVAPLEVEFAELRFDEQDLSGGANVLSILVIEDAVTVCQSCGQPGLQRPDTLSGHARIVAWAFFTEAEFGQSLARGFSGMKRHSSEW